MRQLLLQLVLNLVASQTSDVDVDAQELYLKAHE